MFLVLLPLRTNDVLLGENLVYLGDRNVDTMFYLKKVLNLLTTTIILPLPYLPDPTLVYRVNLSLLSFSFLGLMIPIQEAHQSILFDCLNPEMNGFPVFA